MHSYYRSKGVDYRHYENKEGRKAVAKTKYGADMMWDLKAVHR